jgi:extracellular factor (EF) 3-hydroxypalmitic acid methyl ester biosynthesis protein
MKQEALSLLEELGSETADWILSVGTERQVAREQPITIEGQELGEIFIVLDGLFAVRVREKGSAVLALLGPGELVGEISFLERLPASANVVACEDSRVLCVARLALQQRIEADPAFAANLYRGFARVLSRRLRERSAALAESTTTAEGLNTIGAWRDLVVVMEEFKKLLQVADAAASHSGGIPSDLAKGLDGKFDEVCKGLSRLTREIQSKEILAEAEIVLRREFAPYIHLTKVARRALTKPRGYAGDFLTISWMYDGEPGGVAPLGPLIDDVFFKRPVTRAVQNRRGILVEEIGSVLERCGGSASVTSLACGPAQEIFDLFRASPAVKLKATLIDIDFEALAFVAERRDKAGLNKSMRLEHANLVYLATGRQKLDLNDQQLIYSLGLIDYFADPFVIALLNWIHSCLATGGKVILGNFHSRNPDRAMCDLLLDWKLIHRSEEDMHRLFEASKFGRSCTEIRCEQEGINMFACCIKE